MIKSLLPNRAPVVKSLELVTDYGKETPPDYVDLKHKNIETVWRSITNLYKSGAFPGVSICIRKHGSVVMNRAIGFAQGGGPGEQGMAGPDYKNRLMRTKTPVCLFSASKAITAILTFKLIEDGLVQLDDRVADYLPEFANGGKANITIAQVLNHRSGVPWYQLPATEPTESMGDWDKMLSDICSMKTQMKPGTLAYHAFTGGFVLGEIIQRTAGMSMKDYIKTYIADPMGMRYFTYGIAEQDRQKVATNYVAGDPVLWPVSTFIQRALSVPFNEAVRLSNLPEFMDACVPAGNLYATAEELSRFYQMLLDKGEYDGKTILKPATVQQAIEPVGRLSFDRTLMMPMQYSHGFMLGQNPVGMYGMQTGNAFGHIGFMNIFGWADPDRDLSVGLLVNGKALLGTHLLHVGKFLSTISWQMR